MDPFSVDVREYRERFWGHGSRIMSRRSKRRLLSAPDQRLLIVVVTAASEIRRDSKPQWEEVATASLIVGHDTAQLTVARQEIHRAWGQHEQELQDGVAHGRSRDQAVDGVGSRGELREAGACEGAQVVHDVLARRGVCVRVVPVREASPARVVRKII